MNLNDDNEDFFDSESMPEEEIKQKPAPKPSLSPDDPDYWESPESDWEHLRPARDRRTWIWIAIFALVTGFFIGLYIHFFTPYVDEAVQYGYVESVQKKGSVFKTFEGVILPYKEIHDTTRVYKEDFVFTAADAHVAAILKRMEYARTPVRVAYKVYRVALPWRGDSKVVVIQADPVDPNKILPPEFNTPLSRKDDL